MITRNRIIVGISAIILSFVLLFTSTKQYIPSTFVLDAEDPVIVELNPIPKWRQPPKEKEQENFSKPALSFNPYDITEPSNLTYRQLHNYLSAYCKNWVGLEDFLLQKDKEINLIFLLAVAKTETGAGIITHGYYNCFNIRQENSYYFVNYNSYEESIEDFIYLILKGYVAEDGTWYEQPWVDYIGMTHTSTSLHTIGLHYADSIWAPYIENIGWEIKAYAEKQTENKD